MAESAYDKLLAAAENYLRSEGINPIVIGNVAIQHQPEARRMNHELVISFTAAIPEKGKT
jgi:hypothetical protein